MAGERVLGRAVLAHLVDAAKACGPLAIAIHARIDEHALLTRLLGEGDAAVTFATGPPPEDRVILRADRLYDPHRLRKAVRAGRDVETAVIWRLDRPSGLASADQELTRRRSYQPLGRFWAFAPARALASALAPTIIRPNVVTILAGVLMLAAAGVVATGWTSIASRIATALLLAMALILDTSDGHLARLQGTASEFGRWLDAILDELADLALHAAIAWGLFARTGSAAWLIVGASYMVGKYLFVVAQQESPGSANPDAPASVASPSRLAACVRMVGHADVRWHAWILLAAIGRLDVALVAYAAYFPVRTLAIGARKAARHA